MTILSQSFLTLVSGHLMSFSFFSAWHNFLLSYFLTFPFTSVTKLFDGLNEGMKCSGILMVTFFEMLRAVFSALFLTTKLPKPLKYTFLPPTTEFFIDSMKASTVACTATFSIPVVLEISLTISALVIFYKYLIFNNLFPRNLFSDCKYKAFPETIKKTSHFLLFFLLSFPLSPFFMYIRILEFFTR